MAESGQKKQIIAKFYLGMKPLNYKNNKKQGKNSQENKDEHEFIEMFSKAMEINLMDDAKNAAESNLDEKADALEIKLDRDNEEEFLGNFAGLRFAYRNKTKQIAQQKVEIVTVPQCCRMFLMIMMFIFHIISLGISSQPEIGYFNAAFYRDGLEDNFNAVSDQTDLREWLTNDLGRLLFPINGTSGSQIPGFASNTTLVVLN